MNRAVWKTHMLITAALLAVALGYFEHSNLDLQVQDEFFLGQPHKWRVDARDPTGRFLFYTGAKVGLVVLGSALLLGWIGSFKSSVLRPYRRRLLLVAISLGLVPLTIAGLKEVTNVYWPDQLERYGGGKPYVRVFAPYPAGYTQTKRGKGFPAGHASGGFALMALYFAFRSSWAKRLALSTGLVLGWVMGLYQMAKGVHFLSHTVVTMLSAWLLILILYRVIGDDPVSQKSGSENHRQD